MVGSFILKYHSILKIIASSIACLFLLNKSIIPIMVKKGFTKLLKKHRYVLLGTVQRECPEIREITDL